MSGVTILTFSLNTCGAKQSQTRWKEVGKQLERGWKKFKEVGKWLEEVGKTLVTIVHKVATVSVLTIIAKYGCEKKLETWLKH